MIALTKMKAKKNPFDNVRVIPVIKYSPAFLKAMRIADDAPNEEAKEKAKEAAGHAFINESAPRPKTIKLKDIPQKMREQVWEIIMGSKIPYLFGKSDISQLSTDEHYHLKFEIQYAAWFQRESSRASRTDRTDRSVFKKSPIGMNPNADKERMRSLYIMWEQDLSAILGSANERKSTDTIESTIAYFTSYPLESLLHTWHLMEEEMPLEMWRLLLRNVKTMESLDNFFFQYDLIMKLDDSTPSERATFLEEVYPWIRKTLREDSLKSLFRKGIVLPANSHLGTLPPATNILQGYTARKVAAIFCGSPEHRAELFKGLVRKGYLDKKTQLSVFEKNFSREDEPSLRMPPKLKWLKQESHLIFMFELLLHGPSTDRTAGLDVIKGLPLSGGLLYEDYDAKDEDRYYRFIHDRIVFPNKKSLSITEGKKKSNDPKHIIASLRSHRHNIETNNAKTHSPRGASTIENIVKAAREAGTNNS